MDFDGAKLALYCGEFLAVIRRDDRPDLPYPDYWDLPGGGREDNESPLRCALRECREELGLAVPASLIRWKKAFEMDGRTKWFFVAELPLEASREIWFGNEGQGWELMEEADFLSHPKVVPGFQDRLREWIAVRDGAGD